MELIIKCYICDRDLSEPEVVWNNDAQGLEPCGTCLTVIYETAYSGDFAPDPSEDDLLDDGAVEVLLEDWDENGQYEMAFGHFSVDND